MADLHCSKSELFWYGVVTARLRLISSQSKPDKIDAASDSQAWLDDVFFIQRELSACPDDAYRVIAETAAEFGLAHRVSLEPAGFDPDAIGASWLEDVPDDVQWCLADGTPITAAEWAKLDKQLNQAREAATEEDPGDPEYKLGFMQRMLTTSPEIGLDFLGGEPLLAHTNLRLTALHQHGLATGPFVAEGHAESDPLHIYRITWAGDTHRFHVVQQTSPLYASLLLRFRRELSIPRHAEISLRSEWQRLNAATAPRPPRQTIAAWVDQQVNAYGDRAEWAAGYHLADAGHAARVAERFLIRHQADFEAAASRQATAHGISTRKRIDEFCAGLRDQVELRLLELCDDEATKPTPSPDQSLIFNARYAVQSAAHSLQPASAGVADLGLTEVKEILQTARSLARDIDTNLRSFLAGNTTYTAILDAVRQLNDAIRDCMKLAYGQLYFRELAEDEVYIDAPTRATLLNEPRAIREQLAEAVSQFERGTLANSPVTSVCGLVEPVVRKLAEQLLPNGNHRGDPATILKGLRQNVMADLDAARKAGSPQGGPNEAENRALTKLYLVSLAFACHSLGNSVRHNPEKVLRRHDAGVMLHGLCTLLYRPGD
jgi:hypothetical protein